MLKSLTCSRLVWVWVVCGVLRLILLLRHNGSPPRSGAGGDLDKLDRTHTWTQVRLAFWASLWLISRNFLAPPPLRKICRWLSLSIYSSPLRLGLPFFLFHLASIVGFVALPFRGVGVGFEEPRLRLVVQLVDSGFP